MKNLIVHFGTFASSVIISLSSLLIEKINKALSRNKTRKRDKIERE